MSQNKVNILLKILRVKEYRGLCGTCKNNAHCTFARNINEPVLQCEEFDGCVAAPSMNIFTKKTVEITVKKEDAEEYKGLCVNCANREECTYTKPEGGVWHCDEYE